MGRITRKLAMAGLWGSGIHLPRNDCYFCALRGGVKGLAYTFQVLGTFAQVMERTPVEDLY